MKKEIKTILFLCAPVVLLIVCAVNFDERNRVVYEKVEVVPNKWYGKRMGWSDTSIEMRVSYRPSPLRRLQLAFTKYPQVHPVIGETYLVDEKGNQFREFTLPTGKITADTWGGWCVWDGCMKENEKFISSNSHAFPQRYRFPFLLRQVPHSSKRVYLHTQFESYGTPQQEIKVLVRE